LGLGAARGSCARAHGLVRGSYVSDWVRGSYVSKGPLREGLGVMVEGLGFGL
jgi:hypothetical protein